MMRRKAIRLAIAASVAFSVWGFGATALTGLAAARPQAFIACEKVVRAAAGTHPSDGMTLAQARVCSAGLPEYQRGTLQQHPSLPTTFLVTWKDSGGVDRAFVEWTTIPDASVLACNNTWTSPSVNFWYVAYWGGISASGYGNHCNYANIPSSANPNYGCAACLSVSASTGRADSVWDKNNYNINSALGWGNFTFTFVPPLGVQYVACRVWIDTSGGQNPSPWCQ